MKIPEYSLKKGIEIPTGPMSDPIEFPAGTLCHPFWSECNLPAHIKDQLHEHVRFLINRKYYVMCLIGRT
jgi:hypothetical protein